MDAPIVTPVTHVVFDVDGVLIGMILKYASLSIQSKSNHERWVIYIVQNLNPNYEGGFF